MNTKVEAQGGELVLRNTHGDVVIIPRNKRREALGYLAKGDHRSIDAIAMKLPKASDYAMSGGVYDGGEDPNDKIVKVNQNNEVKEYNTSSQEYRDLYNTGKLMNYDKNTDTYIAAPLKEVNITAEAPQWIKDKRKYESQYSKDWYIDNKMPKFSRAMGVSSDNMHPNSVKEYNNYINNKVVEDIFKRKPTFDNDYSNDRLKTLQEFSQKELELIKNSSYASKIEPSIWSKFEQGLLSVGNVGSPVQFKNPSLSQEEAKKEDNPLNILQPLNIPSKMVQSTYKDNYSFKDALKGKQNNANIVEDIVTDPLNLIGLGIWGKLSKANNFAKLEDAYQAIKTLDKTTLEKQIGTTLSNDDWQYLYRVQEKGFDIEKPTLKAIEERVASGKGKWYDNNILNNPELRANMESRDRYYGQWFEQDPKRLDYYLADKENIEILRAKVPKEILEQYRIDNFDPEIAKKWSLSHETEYIIPKDLIQKAEKFKRNDWQKLIDEHEAIKSKVLNKTDDVVKNLPKLEQIDPFKVNDKYLTKIRTDFHNNERILTSKEYLDLKIHGYGNPEAYKKLNYDIFKIPEKPQKIKTFKNEETKLLQYRDDYIDLITSNNNIEKAKLVDKRLGTDYVGAINKIKENKERLPIPKYKEGPQYSNKGGEYSKQTNIVNKYKYKNVDGEVIKVLRDDFDGMAINVYNSPSKNTVWHEYRHMFDDIAGVNKNKNVVKELKDFMDVNEKGYSMIGNTTSKSHNLSPQEIYTMLGTEFRMDLVERGILKDFDDVLTYDKLIKGNNLLNENFQNAIKDKEKFIKWFNNTLPTISLPAALYLQSQQNKNN